MHSRHHILPNRLRITTILALVVTALATFPALAHAKPGDVAYTVNRVGNTIEIAVRNGTLITSGGRLAVRNSAGAELISMPLSYRMEDRQFPIDARGEGARTTLTPIRDPRRSVAVSPVEVESARMLAANQRNKWATPRNRQERDNQALALFNEQLRAGMSISSIVGAVTGFIIGGVIGCLLAGVITLGIGCLPAMATFGSLGSISGLILGGGGSLIVAGVQYFQTINSPFRPAR